MKLVLLRPEPGLSASAERARAMGLEPVALPLFDIRPVAWVVPAPDEFDGLLLTSANAVRHAGAGLAALAALPVRAVGTATAAAARAAGLDVVEVGTGGVAELGPRDGRWLHLCGRDRVAAPAEGVEARVVYEAVARDAVDLSAVAGAVVAVHSPRAGRRLDALAAAQGLARAKVAIAAISPAAAAACGAGWAAVEAATQPGDAALLALAARLCQKRPQ